ncbi:MAG: ATP-binding protein, partial [Candidatus Limnocylindria bacterium]
ERAMAVRPGFRVDASNAPAIAEICARLDGLPLAIELAAARVRVLTPQAIMARLGDRLSLLGGGSRNLPERQQTLRGAIDWSHDLLEAADRMAFARFSAFAGGADVPAVEQVLLADWPAEAGPAPDALDALTSLLDKSLVRQEMTDDGEPRFRMLETIREYAVERLEAAEPQAATRLRHAEYYLALAEGIAPRLFGKDQRFCLDVLERELDNLRGAIDFAVDRGLAELAMRLVATTWRFWQMRGYLSEGREQAERVLALPRAGVDPIVLSAALEAAGGLAYWQGDLGAAQIWYAEALELERAIGDDARIANALYNFSFAITVAQERVDEARRLVTEAVEIYRRLGDEAGLGRALWGLANTYYYERDSEGGLRAATEGLEISRRLGDRFMTAWASYMIGLYNLAIDRDVARRHLEEALPLFLESDDKSGYALLFDGFATLEWAEGDVPRAMRLAGYAAASERSVGTGLAKLNREFAGFFPETLMDQAPLAAEYAEGQRLTLAQATDLALHRDPERGTDT